MAREPNIARVRLSLQTESQVDRTVPTHLIRTEQVTFKRVISCRNARIWTLVLSEQLLVSGLDE